MLSVWFILGVFLLGQVIANPEENDDWDNPDLFQGDMILTPEERMSAELGLDVSTSLSRGSMKDHLWPNGVVHYELNETLASNEKALNVLLGAMELWSSKTCIKFVPRTTQTAYVHIWMGKGCHSAVGCKGRLQKLSIGKRCLYPVLGKVAHEIGHTLGLHHEQSRPDRDDYVTIKYENVIPGKEFNFKKYRVSKIDSLGSPYDYESVMHYGATWFSVNKLPTIVPKKAGVTLGNRNGPSAIDIQQMNLLYKCP